ncbi:hypothetical protein ACIKK6_10700, partial [Bacillus thuringiensis]
MKKIILTGVVLAATTLTSLLGAGAFTAKAADNTDSLKFNDVPANHWSTKAIYDLTNRKVVQG